MTVDSGGAADGGYPRDGAGPGAGARAGDAVLAGVAKGPGRRAVRGRDAGPVQATCEVMRTGHIGSYRSLVLVAPEIAARARPGQFVTVAVGGRGALLRRPFSLYRVSRHRGGGTIEIVYNVIGEGTRWLAQRDRHDAVDVVGPLGNGFPLPQNPDPCLLVGGGYGAAPLLYLAERLQREGCRVDVVFGAGTADRLFNVIDAKRLAATATFTTDDGSAGVRGMVTDVFDDVVDRAGTRIVYACGPMPMLDAVAQAAARRRLPSQIAVEEAMACGVGVCMTCVVPIRTDEGVRNLRACYEGPVFLGRRVAWEARGDHLPPAEFTAPPADPTGRPAESTGRPAESTAHIDARVDDGADASPGEVPHGTGPEAGGAVRRGGRLA